LGFGGKKGLGIFSKEPEREVKIISWNVNGLKAVLKKGFLEWMEGVKADAVCLQEIKAQEIQLPLGQFPYIYLNPASKKGYSGVLLFSKNEPLKISREIGLERFDTEGRFLQLDYPGWSLINVYLPHGGRQKQNLAYKLEAYDFLIEYLGKIKNQKIVVAGDFNVARQEIDLARPTENQNNIMFTQKEREKVEEIAHLGFIDSFRKFHEEDGFYTWWPYGFKARERNIGWRIDYIWVSGPMVKRLREAFVMPEVKGSDHCPVGIEIV
jgi:exodeoxyribonuclease-3